MLSTGQYLLTLQFTLTDRRLHIIMDMDKCHITMEIIGMLLTNLLYLLLNTLLSLYPQHNQSTVLLERKVQSIAFDGSIVNHAEQIKYSDNQGLFFAPCQFLIKG